MLKKKPGPGSDLPNVKLSYIRIAHNNVCSLCPKVDIFTAEMSNFDVICISETHLDNSIHSDSIVIDGFHPPLRKDRNRQGGGVAIYISSYLSFIERTDLSTPGLEILWAEINVNCKKNSCWCFVPTTKCSGRLLELFLLYGDSGLLYNKNVAIFKIVYDYI